MSASFSCSKTQFRASRRLALPKKTKYYTDKAETGQQCITFKEEGIIRSEMRG